MTPFRFSRLCVALAFLSAAPSLPTLRGEIPRALPAGKLPDDARLEPPKDLDGYFPFTPSGSAAEWSNRAERVRRQIQVAMGLWPMPTKTPLNPVIHGRMDRGDYTVEKVYFESAPGFFVTGNLYRPKQVTGQVPGILCPHGHWANGRFYDAGAEGVKREIAQGAERFEEGGRSVLQARCVQLARMGTIVFHYDMLGYADSIQIPMEIAHNFAKQRPEMNSSDNWGLYSPQAESHLQSIMMLQTWNSIRSLDFLLTLPEVDPARIACTGASGGGTQTFILSALDPRVAVSFPAVMVSTAMQGGCTCENASCLRVNTGNVEFAALFAPKPLGLTSADDWTKEMSTKGFPELKRHYQMLGAPDNVMLKRGEEFGHNYNSVSRAAMYSWFNKHLKLGLPEPVEEKDYKRLSKEEMSVWDDGHPQPPSGPDFERKLLRWLTDDNKQNLTKTTGTPETFRRTVGGGVEAVFGRTLSDVGPLEYEQTGKVDQGNWTRMTGLLRNKARHEELPIVFCYPKEWNGTTVIWPSEMGKSALFFPDGGLKPDPAKLVTAGATVVGIDLLHQGEFTADGKKLVRTPRVKNPREAAAYTFGYNPTVFASRVHDLLTVIQYVRTHERPTRRLVLLGLEGSGPWAAAARALAGDAVQAAAIETGGFRFGNVGDIQSPDFLPGGAKYGDLPGMLALNAPGELWVAGESSSNASDIVSRYASMNATPSFTLFTGSPEMSHGDAIRWVLTKIRN